MRTDSASEEPHETKAPVFGYESPLPTFPATTATLPLPVPSFPERDASAGEVEFMCHTPTYPARVQTTPLVWLSGWDVTSASR